MTRTGLTILLALTILTAGCSGYLEKSSNQTTSLTTIQEINDETTTTKSENNPDKSFYSSNTDTGKIVLSISDVDDSYNFTSESIKQKSDLDAEKKEKWERRGIIKQHMRIFTLGDKNEFGNSPSNIISSVTLYESSDDAQNNSPKTVLGISDTDLEQVELPSGYTATMAKAESKTGNQRVMLYLRDNNMIAYVVVSGKKSNQTVAKNLLVKMIAQI